MHFEQAIQLQRATLFHDLAAAEDNQVVGDQGCGGLRHGRHGGDALLEAPVFRFVAQQCVEGMGEDGPELVNEFQSSAVIREVGKGERGCVVDGGRGGIPYMHTKWSVQRWRTDFQPVGHRHGRERWRCEREREVK